MRLQPHAATYYVRAGGNERADGKTPATAFRTLLRATRLLNHGDRLVIGPGVYRESVLIAERFGTKDARLAVVGDEAGRLTGGSPGPVVLESNQPGEPVLYFHRVTNLAVSGLTIRGIGEGLRVEKARGVLVERCTFDRLAKAVSITDTEDVRVESALITRGLMGIVLKNTARTRLAHLTVASSSAAGIMISTSPGGTIRNCLLVDNSTGMMADTASAPSGRATTTPCRAHWEAGGGDLCRIIYEWYATSGQERHSNYVLPAFVNPDTATCTSTPVSWAGGLPGMDAGIARPGGAAGSRRQAVHRASGLYVHRGL